MPATPVEQAHEVVETTAEEQSEYTEFEIVLGRRQIASVAFLAIVVLVAFSAVSYVVGRSIPGWTSAQTSPAQVVVGPPIPMVKATLIPPPYAAVRESKPTPQPVFQPIPVSPEIARAPMFAEPVKHLTYIQMAAVEKGVAVIFVEGLRTHGLASFVAPGPSEKIVRVVIGPLPDDAAYKRAQAIVDQIGLSTFIRRFEE
jgi:hypothetical protein